jgi:hypothetical protein
MLNPIICPECFQPNEPGRAMCWKCLRQLGPAATEKDFLRFFELRPTSSREDLKVAFRRLAKKYHPDVNQNNREADSYFKFVNSGYELLTRTLGAVVQETAAPGGSASATSPPAKAPRSMEFDNEELNEKLRALQHWSETQGTAPPPPTGMQKLGRLFKRFLGK